MITDHALEGCPLAVVDVETTGLDTTTARIVDVAVVHVDLLRDEEPVVAFSSLVNPGIPIPADSTRITGIDDAMVAQAPPWKDVVESVRAACRGRLVVAHNAPYDYSVVRAETARLRGETPPAVGTAGWPWACTHVLRRATKTRGRPGRLGEIAEEYGIVLDAHGAAGDALTTALIVGPMMRRALLHGALRGPEGDQPRGYRDDDYDDDDHDDRPNPKTVAEYLAWQRSAALWQEREWASYRRQQGDQQPPRSPWHELYGQVPPTWGPTTKAVRCSSCGSAILWRVSKEGKRMPVDATAVEVVLVADANGAPEICGRDGYPVARGFADGPELLTGHMVPADVRPELKRTSIRLSHFATCAHADQHRKSA